MIPQADPAAPAAGTAPAERLLGHRFARADLLREALTHRSALDAPATARRRTARSSALGSNERLEFLGDRVLGLVMAEWLVERFPREQEGELGRRHAHLVSQPVIAAIAEALGLSLLLSVSPGESRAGVRNRATVLADATEALIGALYLDAGLEKARAFVRRAWHDALEAQTAPPKDAKTTLQEWLLARGRGLPCYRLVATSGPPHEPAFTVRVSADDAGGETPHGEGTAGSKRVAERLAAEDLLRALGA